MAVTIVKWEAAGVTIENVQRMIDDPFFMGPILHNKTTYETLPDVEGCKVAHLKAAGPMMVSTRNIINTAYKIEKEGGEVILMQSSQGNEEITAGRSDQIGSWDVIANMILSYWSFKPMEGGLQITMIQSFDPCGMIPGFLKNLIATRTANQPALVIDYLVNGVVPESVF